MVENEVYAEGARVWRAAGATTRGVRGRLARLSVTPAARRLRARLRRLSLVWLIVLPLALLAVITLIMQVFGIVGWDAPAHLYKIALLREHQSIFWDNNWYGGAYQIISYGFIFYYLAQYISYNVVVVVSTGFLPLFFYLYSRKMYGVRSYWPSIVLAIVLAFYLANGQDPFLFAMSFMFLGMVLLAYKRPLLAALPVAVALFANPMALVIGAVFLVADFTAKREVRRDYLRFALYVTPFFVARVAIMFLFYEQSSYIYSTAQVLLFVGFSLAGFVLARVSHDPQRRAMEILFLTFAVVAVATALVPQNPVGSNIGRVFFLFGAPLLLNVRRVFLPKYVTIPVVAGVIIGQLIMPGLHYTHVADLPSTRAAFFTPALRFAATHYDPNYRFHVVALDTHWEAYYFSVNGYPITRGWFRQDDALHNTIFDTNQFTAAQYVAWLRDMGVKYIFLPHAPLDFSGPRETHLLETTPSFVRVFSDAQWTVYRLSDPQPMAVPLSPSYGKANIISLQHQAIYLTVPHPGTYLIKITYSPYWELTAGSGTLQKGANDFLVLDARQAGFYGIQVTVNLQSSLRQMVRAF